MNREELCQLQKKQQAFYESGQTRKPGFRLEALRKLREAIYRYEPDILDALLEDFGKPVFEGISTETRFVVQEINRLLAGTGKWSKTRKVPGNLALFPAASRICPEPYGRVLIISPWNYPIQLALVPLAGALAAGNCVSLKTSRQAGASSLVIDKIIRECFPEEYVAHIPGSSGVNEFLLDERYDYIFFTGSTAVGKKVMQAASKFLTPVSLELGGKNPCIVDADAHLEHAARRIAWGKLINAGQTCVAPDYLLVHEHIREALVEKMARAIDGFYGPRPELSPDYARIIDEQHFNRLCSYLENVRILYGGNSIASERYIQPSLIDPGSAGHPVMKEEIFGPVLPVLGFTRLEEAFETIRQYPQPLAAYFFSRNRKKQKEFLCSIPSGTGGINDTVLQIANPSLPYGGRGFSGIGKYHGKSSFDTFTHYRSLIINHHLADIPLRYPPYQKWKHKLARWFIR